MPVRRALHLRPGTRVEVVAKGNVAFLVPVLSVAEVRRGLAGKLNRRNLRDKTDREL